jgi:hypothetical protein
MINPQIIDAVASNIGRALILSQPGAVSPAWHGLAALPVDTQKLCRRVAIEIMFELEADMLMEVALEKLRAFSLPM